MKLICNFWDQKLKIDKDLLGGKGASLVQMTQLNMPVPPGFILTTHAWRSFDRKGNLSDELITQIKKHLGELEVKTGLNFGSSESPLLVSVRSGGRSSMPGMMDTILDVGVNKSIILGLAKRLRGEVYALDTYRRFVRMFGSSVYGIHAGEFDLLNGENVTNKTVDGLLSLIKSYEKLIFSQTGKRIPDDPYDQLFQSIEAVFRSWYNPGAIAYRQINGIPDQLGTAANIQVMVYGNKLNSGTGVLFTRDTTSGENKIVGDYMVNAQGEDIVRGSLSRKTVTMDQFAESNLNISNELFSCVKTLEKIRKEAQDVEFTVEDGKLWLLQTRSAKRTPLANIIIAKGLYEEGIISESQALARIRPSDVEHVQLPTFNAQAELKAQTESLLSTGITASPGVATGYLCISPTDVARTKAENKLPILVCDHIDPNDVSTLVQAAGIVTTKGSASSHMALIMRSAGIPGIVGVSSVQIDNEKSEIRSKDKTISVGEMISINASKGAIYIGGIDVVPNTNIPVGIKKLIEKRRHLYTQSPWSAGIYKETGSPDIPTLVDKVRTLRTSAFEKWRSEKARVIEVFDNFFDSETMIKNKLVKPNDKTGLEKALISVIKNGYFNAPRTCHDPVKLAGAPWADGPNNLDQIKEFLSNPDYPGKYGGYPRWIEDSALDAIIVGEEPKDKLNQQFASNHFVCTLSCVNGMTSQLVINVNFGTAQLRSLERVESTELAIIKINLVPDQEFSIGDKTYHLGKSLIDDQAISVLAKALKENRSEGLDEVLLRTKRHLLRQLSDVYGQVNPEKIETEELKDLVFDLMNKNKLPADVFRWIFNDQTLSLLDKISKIVLEKWWRSPIYLPHTMAALDEVSGLSVLEAQGRFEGDEIVWFKIYGAKGSEERDRIQNWKKSV